jgi:2-oxoglutarate ferredoxin oxidoreductase subunit delta
MAGKVIIDMERCKGCGLCVTVCPKGGIAISRKSNKNGYFPAESTNTESCTGCAFCAIICPEAIVRVFRDEPGQKQTAAAGQKNHREEKK